MAFWIVFLFIFFTVNALAAFFFLMNLSTVMTAKKIYLKIRRLPSADDGTVLWVSDYLNRIGHDVYLEIVLLALKKKGFRVRRGGRGIPKKYAACVTRRDERYYVAAAQGRDGCPDYLRSVSGTDCLFFYPLELGAEAAGYLTEHDEIKSFCGDRLFDFLYYENSP